MHRSFSSAACCCILAFVAFSAVDAGTVEVDYEGHLGPLFEHFHRNPELSFLEHETAARLAEELRALGIEVTEGVGGTGIVGVIENGKGPTVMIRADMDGLPVREQSGLAYASTAMQEDINGEVVPVMHACGHDVHMTALVGTAAFLADNTDLWKGRVLFIGQPAEERISGAKKMLEDGLYERFGVPDYALALHVSAGVPTGKLVARAGQVYSSSDSLDVIVHGVGAHGAAPHKGVDPIYVGSQLVIALQSLISREVDPLKAGVVTVGSFHAGTKHNIISDQAKLELTVRSDDSKVRQQLLDGIERIARGVGLTAGLPEDLLPEVRHTGYSTPPTRNDTELAERIRSVFVEQFGEEALHSEPREGMGAEDFAYFVETDEQVPGFYFQVGGTAPAAFATEKAGGPAVPSHHSPFFKIEPEPSIRLGVEAMSLAALELLQP